MALIKGSFYSETLQQNINYTAFLPNQKHQQLGVLYLLHGRSGDANSWLNQTSLLRYLQDLPLVVFCPEVHLSYYTNLAFGGKYWDYLTTEFPAKMKVFHPFDFNYQFVAGNSMGGYGSLKWCLSEPQRFDLVGLLSPLIDTQSLVATFPETESEIHGIFGSSESAETSPANLFLQLEKTTASLPFIFHTCGSNDFLIADNLKLEKMMQALELDYQSHFSQGYHDWKEWDTSLRDLLKKIKSVLEQ